MGFRALQLLAIVASCASKSSSLRTLSVRRGAAFSAMPAIEAALRDTGAKAILLDFVDGDASDEKHLAALSDAARRDLLKRYSACRDAVRSSPVPVIALGDGPLTGATAALFLSASRRVVTQHTTYSLGECSAGLCPGFGALATLAECKQPHVAMAVALGVLTLNAHDCVALKLGTDYARSDALDSLRSELLAAPPQYLDVPLSRRAVSGRAPPHLVPLYAAETAAPLNEALQAVFSEPSISAVVEKLDRYASRADEHATALANEPCGIHIRTRERADATRDALQSANEAMTQNCPAALASTFLALRLAASRPRDQRTAESALDMDIALDEQMRKRGDAKAKAKAWEPPRLSGITEEIAKEVCEGALGELVAQPRA